jgi:PPP family 3-phenylpropionic acid transporter
VYLTEIGATPGMVGLAVGLQGLGEIPLYLLAGWIIGRIGPHRTIAIAIAVFGLRSFLYSVITVPALAASVELLHGLSFSLFLVASVQYVDQLVPTTWRATGQSLLSTAYFGAGSIAGNVWAGFLYDRIGIQPMFRVNAGILLVLAVVSFFALRPQPTERDVGDGI